MFLHTRVSPIELDTANTDDTDQDFIDYEPSDSAKPFTVIVPDNLAGMRLDAALAVIIPELSRSKLTNWLKDGLILVNSQRLKPKDKVYGGESILVTPTFSDETLAFTPENIPLEVVYEDEDVLVINKPAGLTVHPGNGNWSGTLLNALLYHYPEQKVLPRAGIVHRLDKDTTGLMVIAKTMLAQTKLVQQLQIHSVLRIYRAIVEGNPPKTGTVNANIGRDPRNRVKMAALKFGGKEAITHYRVLKEFSNFSYIECKLETGRTHQIRVHLKSIGHPLVADPVYGSSKINYSEPIVDAIHSLNRQALHALKLHFSHPRTGEEIKLRVSLANDMKFLLSQLEDEETDYANFMELDDSDHEDDGDWEVIYAK